MGAALWSDEGSSRLRHTPVLDPDIVRALDVGQVAYIHRGAVTFVQVKRLVAAPAALAPPAASGRPGWQAAVMPASLPGLAEPAGRPRRSRPTPGRPARRARRQPGPARCRAAARRGVRAGVPVSADPFAALGLPARPDLTDDDIRAAWRRIAAATHPDRADGGDPARFASAAAAYTELRTRYGRGEAYADLTTRPGPATRTRPRPGPARPAPGRQTAAPPPNTAAPRRDTATGPGTAGHPETTPDRQSATHPETAAPRRETAAHRETLAGLAARVRRGAGPARAPDRDRRRHHRGGLRRRRRAARRRRTRDRRAHLAAAHRPARPRTTRQLARLAPPPAAGVRPASERASTRPTTPAAGRGAPAARRAARGGLGQPECSRQPRDGQPDRRREWLTVYQPPAYAPRLKALGVNCMDGAWMAGVSAPALAPH